ncbi:MAG: hypothetical protein ACRC1U_08660, partial [Vibrionaceae bacterium]
MLPNNVNHTSNISNHTLISDLSSAKESGTLPRIARVNSFTKDRNTTLQTVSPAQAEIAISLDLQAWPDDACARLEYLQQLLRQNICFAGDDASSGVNLEPGQRLYEASADGACMFRTFFAAITRNPAWLSARQVSRKKLVRALNQTGFAGGVRMGIARSLQLARNAALAEIAAEHPLAEHPLLASGFDLESIHIVSILLEPLANLETADEIYRATIARGQFSLWRTDAIRDYLVSASPDVMNLLSDDQQNELAEYLANLIAQCTIESLGIPIQTHLPVHLRADGLHYNLVANEHFFEPTFSEDGGGSPQVTEEVLTALNQIAPPQQEPDQPYNQPLKIYHVECDDAAYPLFRLLLAGITQEQFWLSVNCTTELLQDVVTQLGWTTGQQQAATDVVA